jgi:hypothetical protein
MPQSPAARSTAAVLALLSWSALILQLYLTLKLNNALGIPLSRTLINFFSFFTVLSNLLIALVHTFTALTSDKPSPNLQAAMATYIAVVASGYSLLLRHIWNPQGLQKVADVLLHDAIPILYVLFWFIFCRKRKALSWSDAFSWLIVPTLYLIYSMVRGSITGWYPYHFLDPAQVSHTSIFIVIISFIVAFIIMGLIVIALTRRNSVDTSLQ